jgi:hypothetical protein
MKARKFRMLPDDGRLREENAEMGWGSVGGTGGIVGEKQMRWKE